MFVYMLHHWENEDARKNNRVGQDVDKMGLCKHPWSADVDLRVRGQMNGPALQGAVGELVALAAPGLGSGELSMREHRGRG